MSHEMEGEEEREKKRDFPDIDEEEEATLIFDSPEVKWNPNEGD